ncbi:TPA: Asp-tRNA(Asn)/Glu-tRNA(Gln) amidotransferase GatCAB subunit C [Candidatus Marinimicrobia bacterium]|nr:MAG: Aspartyl/glutamyl-tRNA(Asn/Gln) amidotransferase subunit C [Marinimicrobia bacterium 46_47]HAE87757.1 Asp-tRNA(Asn)/Glu-tRNA(Gln) amidotransferase GatCAB subunit C [Candidatus Neomarinimicrobiota bacterium]HBY19166.1 Asp-tRNA(Asn)/Glu-tRNA(Gln) amidotransferase GatCAB subunit C [Candidatus Neomarinimicrobiota bacterium]
MSISREEVLHIAKLARLSLSEEEITMYTHQLGDILNYVQKLNELNIDDVEPMKHVLDMVNVLREDKDLPSLSREDVLKNAPEHDEEFFKVPRVLRTE